MSGHDQVRLGAYERHEWAHIEATVRIRPGRWYRLTRQASMMWFLIPSACSAAAFFTLLAWCTVAYNPWRPFPLIPSIILSLLFGSWITTTAAGVALLGWRVRQKGKRRCT